ncbi:c-type cytochrome [Rhodobacterales bacterium HKCCE2091]|nr:c-type cytochrome [Rhodobacterales bacterium HKCCE2091]
MFDTMTITKIGGGFLGAVLVFMLGGWAASGLYSTEPSAGGHGEEHVPGYSIEVASSDAPASDEPAVPFADVYAAADPDAGARVWRQCQACHALDGANGVGPHLDGVVGRDIASVDGFGYSDALLALEGNWDPEHISEFILSPRNYAPGTAMSFNGLSDVEDRANVIAYIEQQSQ